MFCFALFFRFSASIKILIDMMDLSKENRTQTYDDDDMKAFCIMNISIFLSDSLWFWLLQSRSHLLIIIIIIIIIIDCFVYLFRMNDLFFSNIILPLFTIKPKQDKFLFASQSWISELKNYSKKTITMNWGKKKFN